MSKLVQLNCGSKIPLVGLGTARITETDTVFNALDAALGSGYRLIDTAQRYKNEAEIGQALQILMPKYGLKREDLFITSKLAPDNMSKEKVVSSVEQTLRDLKTNYVDLFLIHHAKPSWLDAQDPKAMDVRKETWLEMERLHAESKLRSIGVSNYELHHLDEMNNYATVQPSALQVQFHPHYCRRDYFENVRQRGIFFQAFSSMAKFNPAVLSEPLLVELADKYKVPVSHILLAWPLALGIGIIPKSAHPERVRENFKAINVKLSEEDVEKIWGLNKNMKCSMYRKQQEVVS